jgi:hypothetical protein
MLIVEHFPEILSKEFINKKLTSALIKLQNCEQNVDISMAYVLADGAENLDKTLISTPQKPPKHHQK